MAIGFPFLRSFEGMTDSHRADALWLSFWTVNAGEMTIDLKKIGFSSAAGRFAAAPRRSAALRGR